MRKIWIAIALGVVLIVFLFLSFFILSTTLSKPSTMTLNVPDKQQTEHSLEVTKTLTIYLGDQQVYLLDRVSPESSGANKALKVVSRKEFVSAIQQERQQAEIVIGKDSLILIIKPLASISYKGLVDVLDQLSVLKIKRYALVDALTPAEKKLLAGK